MISKIRHTSRSRGRRYLLALAFMVAALTGNAQNNQWAWIGGATTTNQAGDYGTQGTAAVTNKPGARLDAMTWTDTSGNLWLFGGQYPVQGVSRFLNDLWKYDRATGLWTWINGAATVNQPSIYGIQGTPDPANRPGGRYGAVSWTDASGNLWLSGGYGLVTASSLGVLNDLWKYDPSINQWTWINGTITGNQAGIYGTKGTADAANRPGARYGAVSWTDAPGNLWLSGGYGYAASGGSNYLNDLWKYNPSSNEWTWMNGASSTNQAGTYGTKGAAAAANSPGARFNTVSWTDTSGKLWLFGGFGYAASGSANILSDLWKYDPSVNQWTWINGTNTIGDPPSYGSKGLASADNKPGARSRAVAWADSYGSFWIFGGLLGAAGLNDLWKYNPATDQWTWINGASTGNSTTGVYGTQGTPAPANTPGERSFASSWKDASGKFWLFGGALSNGGNYMNDLWEYFPPALVYPDTSFSVTGGGSYCPGGSNAPVGLNGSEATVNYQLRVNGNPIGNPVAGTGSAISFGNQTTAGTYTVTGATPDVLVTMADSAVVSLNTLPQVYAGADQDVCAGDSITLSASGASSYTWSSGVPDGTAFAPTAVGTICTTADEGSTFNITLPPGTVITQVLFASYGTPTGSCGNFSAGSCHASGSQPVVETNLLGRNTASFQVTNTLFGDPCNGIAKRLAVQVAYGIPPDSSANYVVTGTDANGCSNTDTVLVNVKPLPSVSAGADQSVCSGESVILTASGTGSPIWDNGVIDNEAFVPSSTTTYTVTNTGANNCTNTDQVEIVVKPLPVVDAGADHPVCAGDLVSLSASGGAASYVWDNGVSDSVPFTASSTTTYKLTGTGVNGCADTDYVLVTVTNPPDVTISPSNPISLCKAGCGNAFLSVPSAGGNSYMWRKNNSVIPGATANSITTIAEGSYTATVSNGCGTLTSSPVIVSVNTPPVVSISTDATTICAGSTAVLSGSPRNTYQWLWEGVQISGATGQTYNATAAGHYTLAETDNNGCQGISKAVIIKVAPVPDAGFAIFNIYSNGTLRLRANQPSIDYQWYMDNAPISGAMSRTHTVTQSGSYRLQTTKGVCTATSPDTTIFINSVVAKMMSSAPSSTSTYNIKVIPNPSSGMFKILTDGPVQAVIKDIQGQTILTTDDEDIDLLNKPAGIYMLELYNLQGVLVKTEKLVKQ